MELNLLCCCCVFCRCRHGSCDNRHGDARYRSPCDVTRYLLHAKVSHHLMVSFTLFRLVEMSRCWMAETAEYTAHMPTMVTGKCLLTTNIYDWITLKLKTRASYALDNCCKSWRFSSMYVEWCVICSCDRTWCPPGRAANWDIDLDRLKGHSDVTYVERSRVAGPGADPQDSKYSSSINYAAMKLRRIEGIWYSSESRKLVEVWNECKVRTRAILAHLVLHIRRFEVSLSSHAIGRIIRWVEAWYFRADILNCPTQLHLPVNWLKLLDIALGFCFVVVVVVVE